MEEIWKDIPGYEGFYEVSTYGNVRSVERKITYKVYNKLVSKTLPSVILQGKPSKNGYPIIHLSKHGYTKPFYIHRLVAEAFIDNPNGFRYINHKDEIKYNNYVGNIEWCTQQYNLTYGTAIERIIAKTRNKSGNPIAVKCYDINHNYLCTYPSMNEARRKLGIATFIISSICSGTRKTPDSQGHYWRYANEREDNKSI